MPAHYLFYRLLLLFLSPVIFVQISWLAIKNKQSRYFWQRLGFHYSQLPENSLWFHCASVGEVNTLLPLLKNLHQKNNRLKIVITTNTITGGKIVAQQNLDYLFHSYLPFDWSLGVKRFLSAVKPCALYVMETEIWPNLFTLCSNSNIPVHIINARLSSKTTTASNWIKALLKSSLSNVNAIYARSEKDASAYIKLGAATNIISNTGNLKLTTALHADVLTTKKEASINRDYVLLASTHQDEEIQIYTAWKSLAREELLIIAPRHPERSTSILKQLNCDNIAVRSKNDTITGNTEVFLLDTVGELKNYFSNAKVVIMGGSFAGVGGHNILEPASYNCAVITGPNMENFKQEIDLMLSDKAIIQANSYRKLAEKLALLLDNENLRTVLQDNTEKLAHNAEEILNTYTDVIINNNRGI